MKLESAPAPQRTTIMRVSKLKWKKKKDKWERADVIATAKDSLRTSCSDGCASCGDRRAITIPLLKLCHDVPVVISCNLNVAEHEASRARCRFEAVKLKPGGTIHHLEIIQVDGCFVKCAAITQIEHLVLRSERAPKDPSGNSLSRSAQGSSLSRKLAKSSTPFLLFGSPAKRVPRINQGMSLLALPINVSLVVTARKLQGQTIKDLLVSGCHHPESWTRVVLS